MAKLYIALVHLAAAHNLPAGLFKTIVRELRLAKIVDRGFVLPGRNEVSFTLLQIIYQQVLVRGKTSLLSEASVFGLAYLGDSATVKRIPLINVLASSSKNPAGVLEIKYFS